MADHRMCKTCVLPESSTFKLDPSGNCALCHSPLLLRHIAKNPDKEQLEVRLTTVRQKAGSARYDCIAAWSGGRDSTYMLYNLVRVHKLRCAAAFGRTPFTPNEIVENVRKISDTLGVDLIEVQTPPNHAEIAGYCLREWIKNPSPILINLACSPCKFVNREIFK
ncbi:MAG: hypothetical protein QME74_10780, partial [Candidatus Edwardsbacteria bacterium]|nr:hypothetical protein [Candidatus Edwardsbacteria bacterium]